MSYVLVEVEDARLDSLGAFLYNNRYSYHLMESQDDLLEHFGLSLEPLQSRGPYPQLRNKIEATGYNDVAKVKMLKIIAQCLVDVAELSGGAALYESEEQQ